MKAAPLSYPITTSGPPLHCFPIINTLCGPNLYVVLLRMRTLMMMMSMMNNGEGDLMDIMLNMIMRLTINLCICTVFMGLFMIRSRGRRWIKTRRTHGDIEWVCKSSILQLLQKKSHT